MYFRFESIEENVYFALIADSYCQVGGGLKEHRFIIVRAEKSCNEAQATRVLLKAKMHFSQSVSLNALCPKI